VSEVGGAQGRVPHLEGRPGQHDMNGIFQWKIPQRYEESCSSVFIGGVAGRIYQSSFRRGRADADGGVAEFRLQILHQWYCGSSGWYVR